MTSDGVSKDYIIARDPTWFPVNLMGKDANLTAFTNDLFLAIAAEEKIRIHWGSVISEDLFQGLDSGEYDAILTFRTPSSHNRQNFLFSNSFFFVGPVLLVPASSKVQSLGEMEGAVIGIEHGTPLAFDVDRYPTITFLSYDHAIHLLDALSNEYIDGAIMAAIPGYIYAHSLYNKKIKILTQPLTKESLKVAARHTPEGEALINHINHGLKALKANGSYDALLDKWGLYNTDVSLL